MMTDMTQEPSPLLPDEQRTGDQSAAKAAQQSRADAYWKANLRLLGTLLAIWFVVSFGFGILLRDVLDNIQIGGFKMGFWFAQQGSIYVFVALIFVYANRMKKLDAQFGVDD